MKKSVTRIDASALYTRIFVSFFFIILFLPVAQMNFHFLGEESSNEKRKLAEMPTFGQMIRPYEYVTAFDRYFNDRYGFRSSLVRLNSLLHIAVLHTSPTRDVVIGEKGWLMYNSSTDGVSLKDYYGYSNFTENELKWIKDRITDIHQELKKRNIHFLFVVVPSKHTMYPEYLPHYMGRATWGKTRLDQLSQALRNSDIDFLDLRFRLWDKKKQTTYPLYSRTDTHWNDLGAFFAYEDIMRHLRRTLPGIDQLNRNSLHVHSEENKGTGDLAGFLNMKGLLSDTSIILIPTIKFTAEPIPLHADYTSKAEREAVGFRVTKADLPVLVMFRDSFASWLIPYLSESFSKSIYIWSRKFDFSIIAREKPAIVIYEISERYLGNLLGVL
jgi:alginate O-acetyltransferase complex protein AlgJ